MRDMETTISGVELVNGLNNGTVVLDRDLKPAPTPNEIEPELPAHPEDFEYVALLRSHDYKRTRWVVVPEGQSLEFDPGTATRKWLRPHLGSEWHLFGFVSLADPRPEWRKR